ncbi:hypothetical protein [Promicromonospora sukumoe]
MTGYESVEVRDDEYDGGQHYNRLRDEIRELPARDLEQYLLALSRLIDQRSARSMDEALFFDLLRSAFTAEAPEFDERWLTSVDPPGRPADDVDGGVGFTRAVVRFQAAELHRMRGKQLADEMRYFGVWSETRHYWCNFDPHSLLECGAAGLWDGEQAVTWGWGLVGELLETGRVYE